MTSYAIPARPPKVKNILVIECAHSAIVRHADVDVEQRSAMVADRTWLDAAPTPTPILLLPSPSPLQTPHTSSLVNVPVEGKIRPVLARLASLNLTWCSESFSDQIRADLKSVYTHMLYKVRGRESVPLNFGVMLEAVGEHLTFLGRLTAKIEQTTHNYENVTTLFSFWALRFSVPRKQHPLKKYTT